MSGEALKVGVLVVRGGVQLLDLASCDVLSSCDPGYLKVSGLPLTDDLLSKAKRVEILYIAESGVGPHETLTLISNGNIVITVSDGVETHCRNYPNNIGFNQHSFETAGKLDYLVIPGPDPKYVATPAEQDFIRAKYAEVSAVLTVCSGIMPALQSGIIAGHRATAPRAMIPFLKQVSPNVEWVDKRWTTSEDGKVWSSGAVTNGLDMMAAFVREAGVIAPEIGNIVCLIHDIGNRSQQYDTELPDIFANLPSLA